MSRSTRLLALIQALRRRRRPVTAAQLASELDVSLRTIYRDIGTLVAQGAPIEGEAGLGYVLKPGFTLPPLMFSEDEVDALILGLQLVSERGDEELERAATDALAKITAVLPQELEEAAAASPLLAGPGAPGSPHLPVLRRAMRQEQVVRLRYTDKKGAATDRLVWPIALGFFEASEVLAAWCEKRRDFRHFRLDRIKGAELTDIRYGRRRRILMAEWRMQELVS